ncbi:glycoside hydrolase family 43 protein [Kibdelosporangium aridum]|uniref:Alpha-L-arabinofuranosidase B (ABFB) domain-containing protein n=1 Tax=Kibdelosporangium aridum TaxID=2030 RepID=A0A1W2G0A9_KIBAR|nr:glycoside hydrolase family 43 protein [Kibdelosporangium aridum]SMD27553.1 Alpha-L-arabinofuranosidase B (ABFB) domain-containing protein [Kibdelosporangium aridum]
MTVSRRTFTRAAVAGAAIAATGVARTAHAQPAANTAYLMTYFTESPNMVGADYGLHLAVSRDGLNWTPLNQNNPVVTPTEGEMGLRDPFVHRKQDGTFVVVATDLKGIDFSRNSQYLHVWDSTNLTSFTGYRRIRMHTLANTHTWAPTVFWDAARRQYGIVYSANSGGDVLMVNYTTDFRTVSSPQVFFSPGFGVLDGDIVVDGGTTYLYYKNLANGNLYGARSSTGAPNSFTTYTGGLRQGNAIEAPLLLKTNEGGWRLWGDSFSPVNSDYYAWSSSNITSGAWTVMNQRDYTPPLNAKHGSMVGITDAEYNAAVTRWGTPNWVRLKSSNFPDRYVRHANYVARLDPYPFDPYQDQMWRMVPGLTDSAGVSFQSVNVPDRYLRHSGYALRLDPNDNTATFRADATFHRVAGLADSAWTSFRSHNFPDRYLRHANSLLRIDPISTATERQDATFRITP